MSPNEEEKTELKTTSEWKHLLSDFCVTTTGHGFFRVCREENRVMRILWIIVLCICVIAGIVHLGLIIHRYFLFEVNAEIEEQSGLPVMFPDVTICSNNLYFFRRGIDKPNIAKVPDFQAKDALVPSLALKLANQKPPTFETIWNNANSVWIKLNVKKPNATDDNSVNWQRQFARFSTNPYTNEAQVVRHKLSLVTRCLYPQSGNLCSLHDNFTEVLHPTLHSCVTFSAAPEWRHVSRTGSADDGLQTDLLIPFIGRGNVDESQFIGGGEIDARVDGMTIVIHTAGTLPDVDQSSRVIVTRGYRPQIAFRMSTTFYKEVNNRCSSTQPNIEFVQDNYNYLGHRSGGERNTRSFAYSRYACGQQARQTQMVEQCGCLSGHFFTPKMLAVTPFCHQLDPSLLVFVAMETDPKDASWILDMGVLDAVNNVSKTVVIPPETLQLYRDRFLCHDRVLNQLMSDPSEIDSVCPLPCELNTYDLGVNDVRIRSLETKADSDHIAAYYKDLTVRWKADQKYTQVLEKLVEDIPHNTTFVPGAYIGGFAIYPVEIVRRVVRENLVYPIENLLSDIGGTFGFWLGFSLITIAELCELCTLLTANKFIGKYGI